MRAHSTREYVNTSGPRKETQALRFAAKASGSICVASRESC